MNHPASPSPRRQRQHPRIVFTAVKQSISQHFPHRGPPSDAHIFLTTALSDHHPYPPQNNQSNPNTASESDKTSQHKPPKSSYCREVLDSSNFLYFATRSHPFSAFFPPRSTESEMFSVLRAQTPVESPHFPITTKTTPAPPHRLHCSKAEYFTTLPHPEDNVSNFTSASSHRLREYFTALPYIEDNVSNAHIVFIIQSRVAH